MKAAKLLLVILVLCSLNVHSQTRKNLIGIGGGFSYPGKAYRSNNAIGLGLNIKGEHFFSSKFSGLAILHTRENWCIGMALRMKISPSGLLCLVPDFLLRDFTWNFRRV